MQSSVPVPGPRVGFLDSGVGGLSVWFEAIRLLPGIRTVYFADRAHCPYGSRPPAEVRRWVVEGVGRLIAEKCEAIVLACNTATAAAIDYLRETRPDISFVGMEPAIKPAVAQSRTGAVGVLATSGTFHGRHFRDTSLRFAGGVRLVSRDAGDLVPYVERGELDGSALCAALEAHLAPMREARVDHIVLGCTHFPFLAPVLQRLAGPGVRLVNPAPAVARQLARVLGLEPDPEAERSPALPLPPPSELVTHLRANPLHRCLGLP